MRLYSTGKLAFFIEATACDAESFCFQGHAGTVNTVRFNEDSSVVISGSIDGTVRCWDVRSKRYEPIQVSLASGDASCVYTSQWAQNDLLSLVNQSISTVLFHSGCLFMAGIQS